MPTHAPTNTLLPAPHLLGLPQKFDLWRSGQAEAVLRALDTDRRFTVLAMPTGFGKSLAYVAAGLLGDPAIILTSTKGLQTQLMMDFEEAGLRDIRGMGNYPCVEANNGQLFDTRSVACDEGPCLSGWKCHHAENGCHYFDAQRRASSSHLASTNYAYWLSVNGASTREDGRPPLGQRGRLILDEAHAAIDELGEFLAIEIGHWEIEGVLGSGFPGHGDVAIDRWRQWASDLSKRATSQLNELDGRIRLGAHGGRRDLSRRRELKDLHRRLSAIAGLRGEWVVEQARDRRGRRVVKFDPVWPGEYAEGALFRGIPRIILTSATIRPKTLDLLGIPEDQYDFIEYPSSFPVHLRPFVWVPTVRVRFDMDPGQARLWVAKVDAIIRARPDRRGIVHTVSYARADYLRRYSEHSSRLVFHDDSRELNSSIRRFLDMRPEKGPVLVSPSVGTGFDFPGDDCRYQIIGKVPFPSTKSKVLEARQQRDPDYFAYVAAQNLVQMAGRGMRSADDWCENLLIDDNWSWFFSKYKSFMPRWFTVACRRSDMVPGPLDPGKRRQ